MTIGLQPTEVIEEESVPRTAEVPERKTSDLVRELINEVDTNLERISKLPTTTKQAAEEMKLLDAIDKDVQKHRFVFRFPIDDVTQSTYRGRYDISLSAPLELLETGDGFRYLSGANNQRMSESVALSIDAGYVYEVSGTGRFGHHQFNPDTGNSTFVFSFTSSWSSNEYALYLANQKTRIVKDDAAPVVVESP